MNLWFPQLREPVQPAPAGQSRRTGQGEDTSRIPRQVAEHFRKDVPVCRGNPRRFREPLTPYKTSPCRNGHFSLESSSRAPYVQPIS